MYDLSNATLPNKALQFPGLDFGASGGGIFNAFETNPSGLIRNSELFRFPMHPHGTMSL